MDSMGTWPLGNRDWVSARFQDQDLISKNYGPLLYKGETRKVDNQNKKGFATPFNWASGTLLKFQVVSGYDTIIHNGVSQDITRRFQCITVMKEYERKSVEELRLEDYQCGRKNGSAINIPSAKGEFPIDNYTATTDTTGISNLQTTTTSGESFGASTSQTTFKFGGTFDFSSTQASPFPFSIPKAAPSFSFGRTTGSTVPQTISLFESSAGSSTPQTTSLYGSSTRPSTPQATSPFGSSTISSVPQTTSPFGSSTISSVSQTTSPFGISRGFLVPQIASPFGSSTISSVPQTTSPFGSTTGSSVSQTTYTFGNTTGSSVSQASHPFGGTMGTSVPQAIPIVISTSAFSTPQPFGSTTGSSVSKTIKTFGDSFELSIPEASSSIVVTSKSSTPQVFSAVEVTASETNATSAAEPDPKEPATITPNTSDQAEIATAATTSDTKSTFITTSETESTSVTGSSYTKPVIAVTKSKTNSASANGSYLKESTKIDTTADTGTTSIHQQDLVQPIAAVTITDTEPISTTLPALMCELAAGGDDSPTDNIESESSPLKDLNTEKGKNKPSPENSRAESPRPPVADSSGSSQLLHELQSLEETRSGFLEIMKIENKMCSYVRDPFTAFSKCASMQDTTEIGVSFFALQQKGVPHGKGVLKNLKQQTIYEGEWRDGKRCGKGSALIKTGCASSTNANGFYTGEWIENMRNGRGQMTFLSGAKYEGEWLYDKMNGVGKMKFPDGAMLEGVWCEDEPQGCGVFTWPNGEREYREYKGGHEVLTGSKCNPIDEEVLGQRNTERLQLESDRRYLCRQLKEAEQTNETKIEELLEQKAEEIASLREEHRVEKSTMVAQHNKEIESVIQSKQELQKELDGEKATKLCQICFDRQRDCILMPCLHFVYCRLCVNRHRDQNGNSAKCPSCNTIITGQFDCKLNL